MNNIELKAFPIQQSFLHDFVEQSKEMTDPMHPMDGMCTIKYTGKYSGYLMKVNLRSGKREGEALIMRQGNSMFMKLYYVNDEPNGEVIKYDSYGIPIMTGTLRDGKESGVFVEYNQQKEEIWRGYYKNGDRFTVLTKNASMPSFYDERTLDGELLNVTQYDISALHKNGTSYKVDKGKVISVSIYSNDVLQYVLMEFNGDKMTEYDRSGRKVYEGGYQEDSQKGYVRSGEGTEFQEDGESTLYYGHFEKGERHGKGTLYKDGVPVFIGQWDHGTQGVNEFIPTRTTVVTEEKQMGESDNLNSNPMSLNGIASDIGRDQIASTSQVESKKDVESRKKVEMTIPISTKESSYSKPVEQVSKPTVTTKPDSPVHREEVHEDHTAYNACVTCYNCFACIWNIAQLFC